MLSDARLTAILATYAALIAFVIALAEYHAPQPLRIKQVKTFDIYAVSTPIKGNHDDSRRRH